LIPACYLIKSENNEYFFSETVEEFCELVKFSIFDFIDKHIEIKHNKTILKFNNKIIKEFIYRKQL